ncbi:MAG: restriction endonuclease subunit S [Candidatus Altimarinota bacterium]
MQNNNLPEGWKIVKLKYYTTERKQKNKANEELTVFSISNKRGFVKSDDYFEGQVYSKDLKNYKIVKKGDFAYNPARINVGSIAYLESEEIGLLSPMYVIFSLNKEIDKDYFSYFIKGNLFNKQVNNFTQGAVRQILSFGDLGNISLLLPPLEVQKEIASKLKELDKLIEISKNEIDKQENLKKAMMKKLFSEGIGHTEFKDSKLGMIPKEWEVKKFKDIIKRTQLGLNMESSIYNEGLPLLKMQNLLIGDFNIDDDNLNKIENNNIDNFLEYKVNYGDFLFNTRNSYDLVGKSATWKYKDLNNFLFNSNIMRVLFKDNVSSFYLNYFFSSYFGWKQLKSITKGTTSVAAIYLKDLNLVKILFPTFEEQKKIADILENIDNLLEKEREIKVCYEKMKKGIVSLVFSCNLLIK